MSSPFLLAAPGTVVELYSSLAARLRFGLAATLPTSIDSTLRAGINRLLAITVFFGLKIPATELPRQYIASRTTPYLTPTTTFTDSTAHGTPYLFLAIVISAGILGAGLVHFKTWLTRRNSPATESGNDSISSKSCYSDSPTLVERNNFDGVSEKINSSSASSVLCGGFLWICLTGSAVRLLAVISRLPHMAQFLDHVDPNPNGLAKHLKDVDESKYTMMENVGEVNDTLAMVARVPPIARSLFASSRLPSQLGKITHLERFVPLVGAKVSGTPVCEDLKVPRPLVDDGLSGLPTRGNVIRGSSRSASLGTGPLATRIQLGGSFHLRDKGNFRPSSSLATSGDGQPQKPQKPLEDSLKLVEKSVPNRRRVSASGTESRVRAPAKATPSSVEPLGAPDKVGRAAVHYESPYLAEVSRLFETPLDVPLNVKRRPRASVASDSDNITRVRSLFQAVIDEIDKPSNSGRKEASGPVQGTEPFQGDKLQTCVKVKLDSQKAARANATSRLRTESIDCPTSATALKYPPIEEEEALRRARVARLHSLLEITATEPLSRDKLLQTSKVSQARVAEQVARVLKRAGKRAEDIPPRVKEKTQKSSAAKQSEEPPPTRHSYKRSNNRTPSPPPNRSSPIVTDRPGKVTSVSPGLPKHVEDFFFCKRETKSASKRHFLKDEKIMGFGVGSPARRRIQRLDERDYFYTSTPRVNFAYIRGFCTSTPRKGFNNRRDNWADFF